MSFCCDCRTERRALFCIMDDVMFRDSALDGRLQIKRIPLFFCVKRNFVLPHGFFIFSLHWILLVYWQIYAALNNITISEPELCSAELFSIHMLPAIYTRIHKKHQTCTWHKALFTGNVPALVGHNTLRVPIVLRIAELEKRLNPLATEFFLILAHPVYKMWITREPKKVALWNKRHFEEKKTESVQHV